MTIQNFTRRALTAAGIAAMLCVAPMIFGQAKKAAAKGDATKGKGVFEDNCSVCHNADSTEKKSGPGLKGLMKKAKMNNGKAPTDANVRALVNAGGNGMPSFSDTLTDEERDNVMAYLKTL
jgi:cytochrome c